MLFNSFEFWVFFTITLLAYRMLQHENQNRMLLVASYYFYGSWDWRFLSLLFLSTVIDYTAALQIQATSNPKRRRFFLFMSLTANLSILGFFKYYGFFTNELGSLLQSWGMTVSLPMLNIILPVGISFYTFQTMSYVIDVYRGVSRPTKSFRDFALYIAFFPHLVAGPIQRSSLLRQILMPRTHNPADFLEGLYYVTIGLFKKVVIADNMALIANTIFQSKSSELTGAECLVGMYAFAFQIYGDFSGYSSIAKGIAKWMGFDLMTNFETPYFATSPQEFWRRWHISLSTWLRDYLYIPLGGSKRGTRRTYINLMITMVLGGLWHGAAWTFIVWGFFHGVLLCIQHGIDQWCAAKTRSFSSPVGRWIAVFVTFHLVCFGWLLFRARSMTQVWEMLYNLFSNFSITSFSIAGLGMIVFYAGPLILYELWLHRKGRSFEPTRTHWAFNTLATSFCLIMLIVFAAPESREFIYFQF
jgi:alginate O-acetyltransferase complex protein AlgI